MPPYMAGMNQFMESALACNNGAKDMLCPCENFHNGIRDTIDVVRCHVNVTGMLKTYTRRIYHRESGGISGTNCTANDDGYESDDDSFQLLNLAFPEVDFSEYYTDANIALSDLGLGYQTIHVCKYDCILYWGDYATIPTVVHQGGDTFMGRKRFLTRSFDTFR
jgi:hypothetical protein